jgi:hypothetical protein
MRARCAPDRFGATLLRAGLNKALGLQMKPFALRHVRKEFMKLPDAEYSDKLDGVTRRYMRLVYVAVLFFVLLAWVGAIVFLAPDLSWLSLLKSFQFAGGLGTVLLFICLWLNITKRVVRCAARTVYLDFYNELVVRRQT